MSSASSELYGLYIKYLIDVTALMMPLTGKRRAAGLAFRIEEKNLLITFGVLEAEKLFRKIKFRVINTYNPQSPLFNTRGVRGVREFFNRTGCTLFQNALKTAAFLQRHDLRISDFAAGPEENFWQG